MDPTKFHGQAPTTVIHVVRGDRLVCMPGMQDLQRIPSYTLQRTDDPRAATCPACLRELERPKK